MDIIQRGVSKLNCKKSVVGNFDCSSSNILQTLKGSPEIVEGYFKCHGCNSLKELKGAPKIVKGEFDCSWCNNLESVEGAPKKCKKFDCTKCHKLKNLDPLLKCEIEEVKADEHLLDDYIKKKKIIEKHGFENAMVVFETLDDLI